MSLGGAIVTRLEAVTGVTDLVGTGDNARIYPVGEVPQNPTKPFIRYNVVTDIPEHAMGSDVGVAHERVQIDSFGDGYDGARALAVQVHAALSRFRGTSASVVIQDVETINKGRDLFEDDVGESRVIQEFLFHYEE